MNIPTTSNIEKQESNISSLPNKVNVNEHFHAMAVSDDYLHKQDMPMKDTKQKNDFHDNVPFQSESDGHTLTFNADDERVSTAGNIKFSKFTDKSSPVQVNQKEVAECSKYSPLSVTTSKEENEIVEDPSTDSADIITTGQKCSTVTMKSSECHEYGSHEDQSNKAVHGANADESNKEQVIDLVHCPSAPESTKEEENDGEHSAHATISAKEGANDAIYCPSTNAPESFKEEANSALHCPNAIVAAEEKATDDVPCANASESVKEKTNDDINYQNTIESAKEETNDVFHCANSAQSFSEEATDNAHHAKVTELAKEEATDALHRANAIDLVKEEANDDMNCANLTEMEKEEANSVLHCQNTLESAIDDIHCQNTLCSAKEEANDDTLCPNVTESVEEEANVYTNFTNAHESAKEGANDDVHCPNTTNSTKEVANDALNCPNAIVAAEEKATDDVPCANASESVREKTNDDINYQNTIESAKEETNDVFHCANSAQSFSEEATDNAHHAKVTELAKEEATDALHRANAIDLVKEEANDDMNCANLTKMEKEEANSVLHCQNTLESAIDDIYCQNTLCSAKEEANDDTLCPNVTESVEEEANVYTNFTNAHESAKEGANDDVHCPNTTNSTKEVANDALNCQNDTEPINKETSDDMHCQNATESVKEETNDDVNCLNATELGKMEANEAMYCQNATDSIKVEINGAIQINFTKNYKYATKVRYEYKFRYNIVIMRDGLCACFKSAQILSIHISTTCICFGEAYMLMFQYEDWGRHIFLETKNVFSSLWVYAVVVRYPSGFEFLLNYFRREHAVEVELPPYVPLYQSVEDYPSSQFQDQDESFHDIHESNQDEQASSNNYENSSHLEVPLLNNSRREHTVEVELPPHVPLYHSVEDTPSSDTTHTVSDADSDPTRQDRNTNIFQESCSQATQSITQASLLQATCRTSNSAFEGFDERCNDITASYQNEQASSDNYENSSQLQILYQRQNNNEQPGSHQSVAAEFPRSELHDDQTSRLKLGHPTGSVTEHCSNKIGMCAENMVTVKHQRSTEISVDARGTAISVSEQQRLQQEQMIAAGLQPTGHEDEVVCQYGCRLWHFEQTDNPVEEHAFHFPYCPFINQILSTRRIDRILRQKDAPRRTYALWEFFNHRTIRQLLSSLPQGNQYTILRSAFERVYSNTERRFEVNSNTLLEILKYIQDEIVRMME